MTPARQVSHEVRPTNDECRIHLARFPSLKSRALACHQQDKDLGGGAHDEDRFHGVPAVLQRIRVGFRSADVGAGLHLTPALSPPTATSHGLDQPGQQRVEPPRCLQALQMGDIFHKVKLRLAP